MALMSVLMFVSNTIIRLPKRVGDGFILLLMHTPRMSFNLSIFVSLPYLSKLFSQCTERKKSLLDVYC